MRNKKNKNLALAALFAALIAALTMVHLPIISQSGYVHFGDSMIYLCASLLPAPYALAAAAIGGALADVFFGYFNWAPFTFVIKAMNALPFAIAYKHMKKGKNRLVSPTTVLMMVASALVTCVFYFFASWVIYGSAAAAFVDLPGSILQAIGSSLIYLLIGAAFDSADVKKKLLK